MRASPGYERSDWMDRAACRGVTELFFHDAPLAISCAKQVCLGCEVREVCYEFAMTNPTLQGVWGKTTSAERRRTRPLAS